MRLTILVDNTGREPFEAEHGFAALVEHDGRLALFDTGMTGASIRNAKRLGLDLSEVEVIALSHGHYDHTGGLEAALEAIGPVRLVAHPAAFGEKLVQKMVSDTLTGRCLTPFSDSPPALREAGIRLTRHELEVLGATIETNEAPVELVPGVWLTGPVPRRTDYETVPASFVTHREDSLVHDDMPDDQSLFVRTEAGIVVVAGCAHAGIVNTLRHVGDLTDHGPIVAVFGGAHLVNADTDRIDRTIAVLRDLEVKVVGLCHCTGAAALDRIESALPDRFLHVHSGLSWEGAGVRD